MRVVVAFIAMIVLTVLPGTVVAATNQHRSAEECRRLVDQKMPHGTTTERQAARARCRAGKPF